MKNNYEINLKVIVLIMNRLTMIIRVTPLLFFLCLDIEVNKKNKNDKKIEKMTFCQIKEKN